MTKRRSKRSFASADRDACSLRSHSRWARSQCSSPGVRLLLTNWRLTLVQFLPAMWIWLATYDLKAHVLHGKSFHVLRGPLLIPIGVAIVAITAASFFLNAVFAFAIAARPRQGCDRPSPQREPT